MHSINHHKVVVAKNPNCALFIWNLRDADFWYDTFARKNRPEDAKPCLIIKRIALKVPEELAMAAVAIIAAI